MTGQGHHLGLPLTQSTVWVWAEESSGVSGTQEFLEQSSAPAASSAAQCHLQPKLSSRVQTAARAAARGKPVLELVVAVVENFATISRFFHPFSASRQFQREGEL